MGPIAAVGGVAIVIGATMLFHFDHVVAGAGAVFSTPFLKLALIPARTDPRVLDAGHGPSALRGRGERWGILNAVVDSAKVDDVALKATLEIAARPAATDARPS
jgi:enoyl-CoA hydratase/carnithine racemase